MTINEAAAALGLAPSTLRKAVHRGQLATQKHGRDHWVLPSEVERYRRTHLGRKGRPRKEQG